MRGVENLKDSEKETKGRNRRRWLNSKGRDQKLTGREKEEREEKTTQM